MEQDLFATLTYDRDPDQDNDLRGAKIELLLSGSDLADLDTFSKSDPMCVVFVKKFGQWKELGRTEAEDETLSPRVSGLPKSLLGLEHGWAITSTWNNGMYLLIHVLTSTATPLGM